MLHRHRLPGKQGPPRRSPAARVWESGRVVHLRRDRPSGRDKNPIRLGVGILSGPSTLHHFPRADRIMARMPARIGSERVGQASMISARSEGVFGVGAGTDWVAVWDGLGRMVSDSGENEDERIGRGQSVTPASQGFWRSLAASGGSGAERGDSNPNAFHTLTV